jgi:protein involved in polysaccharide export with SLBB domain
MTFFRPLGEALFARQNRTTFLPALALGVFAAFLVLAPLPKAQAQQAVNLSDLFKGATGGQGATNARSPNPASANQQRGVMPSLANFPMRKKSVCQFVPMDERGNPLRPPYLVEGATRVPANPAGRTSQGFGSALEDSLQQDQQSNVQTIQVFEELFYYPNAFERYVKTVTGQELCRFGHQLTYDMSPFFEPPPLAMVPDSYLLGPGDEVFIRIWGSVERDMAAVIDRSGLVVIPQVGPVKLGGLAFNQAERTVRRAVSRLYSDFNTSVSLGQLRNIQVFITGYAEKPGAYNVGNLSSLSSVLLAAGGPSSSGSFRNIQLRRGNNVVSEVDLYDLILKGSKQNDRILLNGDVIHVGSTGPQVAVLGGVNHPAVFEVKPSETLNAVIDMAGGLVPGADAQGVHMLPIANRGQGFQAVSLKGSEPRFMQDGDVVVARNDTGLSVPSDKKVKRVTVQGQVRKPGQYFLPASATLAEAIEQAGGLVPGAFVYGTRLTRESILRQQEETLQRVLRELDRDIVASSTMQPNSADEARLLQVRADLSKTLVLRLQSFRPDGRLTLPISPESSRIPIVELQDGDEILVPSIPQQVGVFGSVVSPGSFLFQPNSGVGTYLQLAGGAKKGADTDELFVIRANGEARSLSKGASILGLQLTGGDVQQLQVYPGDTVVVPENMNKTTVFRELRDYATLIYQLGLGVAAFKVLQE